VFFSCDDVGKDTLFVVLIRLFQERKNKIIIEILVVRRRRTAGESFDDAQCMVQ
jgi:hypothetical protein